MAMAILRTIFFHFKKSHSVRIYALAIANFLNDLQSIAIPETDTRNEIACQSLSIIPLNTSVVFKRSLNRARTPVNPFKSVTVIN